MTDSMRILLRSFLIFPLLAGPISTVRGAEPLHVFILAGQSKMARFDPAVSFAPVVETA